MRKAVKRLLALAGGGGLAVAPLLAATPALALPSTVYVSPSGTILNAGTSCLTAQYKLINVAMLAVASEMEGGRGSLLKAAMASVGRLF